MLTTSPFITTIVQLYNIVPTITLTTTIKLTMTIKRKSTIVAITLVLYRQNATEMKTCSSSARGVCGKSHVLPG